MTKVIFVGLLIALNITKGYAQELSPSQILLKVDQVRSPSENFVFSIKVKSHLKSEIIENELDVWVHGSKKSLVLYRKPINQRGRALLLVGQNMWIYIPGTKRPLRISPQQQLLGAVSNADVARVVFSLDYSAENIESVELADVPAFKLNLTAKQKNVSYRTVNLWVAQNDYRPLKAEFYSISGKLLRTISYGAYQDILGKMRPTKLEVIDAVNPSNQSTLTYSNFEVKETPNAYFQPSYLNKLY